MKAPDTSALQALKKEALRIYHLYHHERDQHREGQGEKPDLWQIVRELLVQEYGLEGLQYLQKIMASMSERSIGRRIAEMRKEARPILRETHPSQPQERPRDKQAEFDFVERPRKVA